MRAAGLQGQGLAGLQVQVCRKCTYVCLTRTACHGPAGPPPAAAGRGVPKRPSPDDLQLAFMNAAAATSPLASAARLVRGLTQKKGGK